MFGEKKYTREFESALDEFINELLYQRGLSTKTGDWTMKGVIDEYKNIYTISSDTKIVSKLLEIHILSKLLIFADKAGYKLVLPEKQNYYPDFTFIHKENEKIKFALDLKTTFRRNDNSASFTLGSHGTYFKQRDKKKNIQFPYNQYIGHYCLGIIYTRNDFSETEITKLKNLKLITSVIGDFDFFVMPKWKIASDGRSSGNTANIGSIKNIVDLKTGNGVFAKLGENWFDEYWINYGVATMIKDGKYIPITNIWDFLEFKGRTDLFDKVGSGAKKRKK